MGLYTKLPNDITEVDVIIAGGGTAGCVVAGRLAEADPGLSILVIESGTNNDMPEVSIPALFISHIMPTSKTTLFYKANKEKSVADRELLVASGNVLGGGSSTNMMMYSRAQRSDWDSWNTPGWSADEMIPFLKKLETYHGPGPKQVHGDDGPMEISSGTYWVPRFQDDFIAAATKLGYPEAKDIQDLDTNNAVARPMRYISQDGKRQDAATAYVHPKLQDGNHVNLHVLVASQVVRILFDNKTAVGVEFTPNPSFTDAPQTVQNVKAKKLVVLSCGALGSPSVLERSGVGSSKILEQAKVPQVVDLPGVGDGYEDHHLFMYSYRSDLAPDETLDALAGGRLDLGEMIKNQDKRLGWNVQDIGYRIRPTEDEVAALGPVFQDAWNKHYKDFPDRSLAVGAAINGYTGDPSALPVGQYISISCFTTYPFSRGHVHITGPSLDDRLDFETGFFADVGDNDIKKHIWVYKKQREIIRRMQLYRGEVAISHPPFPAGSQAACIEIDAPLTNVQDIQYSAEDEAMLEKWLRERVETTWHSLGTCKMAPREKMGVVDANLGVYGVGRLKIADLSIAPENVAANTNNTALAIGEKAADIFIQELGLRK